MQHRIAAGAFVVKDDRLLLLRHQNEAYDFWTPPGGGVEDYEELTAAAEREAFEEVGIRVRTNCLAYIDELIDDSGRMIKFWFLADYVSGEIDVSHNPVSDEAIKEAYWFTRKDLPTGHVFPALIRDSFWDDLARGFSLPRKLPLQYSIF